jgi:peroxiredoxin
MLAMMGILAALPAAGQERKDNRAILDRPVADFRLRDLTKDGETHVSLSEFKDKKAVVLIFTSFNCDACLLHEDRIRRIVKDFAGKPVAFLAVRSSAEDSVAGMRKYAGEKKFGIPFLDDPRSGLAETFNVVVTPTFFVIDSKGVLRYRGAFDDGLQEADAKKAYLRPALEAVLEGREPSPKETRTVGCHMLRGEPEK